MGTMQPMLICNQLKTVARMISGGSKTKYLWSLWADSILMTFRLTVRHLLRVPMQCCFISFNFYSGISEDLELMQLDSRVSV